MNNIKHKKKTSKMLIFVINNWKTPEYILNSRPESSNISIQWSFPLMNYRNKTKLTVPLLIFPFLPVYMETFVQIEK